MRTSFAAFLLVATAIAAPGLASTYPLYDSNITIAAPTIDITHAQAQAGVVGYFDVTLTDTAAETFAQFQATMTLSAPGIVSNGPSNNVSIVGADLGQLSNAETGSARFVGDGIGDAAGSSPNLIYPYVLGNAYATTDSSEVSGNGWAAQVSTSAWNSDLTSPGTLVTLVPNTVYSLMQVYYHVLPGTQPGSYALTFDTNAPFQDVPGQTHNDPAADYVNLVSSSIAYDYDETNAINGAIVILPDSPATTPEPGSVVLLLLGASALLGIGWRRARHR